MLVFYATICIAAIGLLYRLRPKRNLPPGPRRLPLVGNALDIPFNDAWLHFAHLRREYGSLVYIEIFGRPFVIVNSYKIALDTMSKRARLYSDRPWSYVSGRLLAGGKFMPFMDFNDKFRRLRRATEGSLRQSQLVQYRKVQQFEAVRATIGLLGSSRNWEQHLETLAASLIMSVVYGLPPTDTADPRVRTVKKYADLVARANYPGQYLVETLPWLRHLPAWAAPWKRQAIRAHQEYSAFFHAMFTDAERVVTPSACTAIFALSLRESLEGGEIDEADAAWLCASLFVAGAETTSSSLGWFVLAMVLHPDVQRKAQAELDNVVGRHRPPSFFDMDKLPYVAAIVKEVLRWRPPIPLGVPHRTAEGDVYEGFSIPPGTVCIPNVWEINHDEEVWGEDASAFRPERHLDLNNAPARIFEGHDDNHMSFGVGKRICVGRHFAGDTLAIACATILWACCLNPPVDEEGVPVLPLPHVHTQSGMTLNPAHFDVEISSRFLNADTVLEATHGSFVAPE